MIASSSRKCVNPWRTVPGSAAQSAAAGAISIAWSIVLAHVGSGTLARAERDSIVERLPYGHFGALLRVWAEIAMRTTLKVLAVISAVLAAGTSSAAMAKSHCASGYKYYNHGCHPVRSQVSAPARSPGYGNPVSGAVSGTEAGASRGAASAGPVGAVVGGALGTASGTVTGTANMLLGH